MSSGLGAAAAPFLGDGVVIGQMRPAHHLRQHWTLPDQREALPVQQRRQEQQHHRWGDAEPLRHHARHWHRNAQCRHEFKTERRDLLRPR